jgi:acyl-CoA synthetase (AMP-forming)/AMP-acid ligase II
LQAGGGPVTAQLCSECLEVFGTPIYNIWGLTEFPAASSPSADDPLDIFLTTVGRMGPGTEARAMGPDNTPVAAGEVGELWVRGPQRCLRYVDDSLNADAFVDDWFRTGDLGTVDADGYVRITGRLKDIIIRNAENLSALEIEDAVVAHPAIADVAVIGLPDVRTGERACAVVVVTPGHKAPTIAELAAHCDALGLARQKIPEQIEIVDELPRNPLGKILKHELRTSLSGDASS